MKLHKDASGDIATDATFTADLPVNSADTLPTAAATVQVLQAELAAILAKITTLEQTRTQVQSQLAAADFSFSKMFREEEQDINARESSFGQKFREQEQNSIARKGTIKDACRQQVAALDSTIEFLSQHVRSKNTVMHGVPETAAQPASC